MKIAIETLARAQAGVVAKFLALATIATALPFFIHVQWLTGPIINAVLILTLLLVGIRSALVVCLIPSLMALSGGLLPVVLAPVVPFIMIGNAILVLTIDWVRNNLQNKGYWVGVLAGASLKFLFLFASVNVISNLLIKQELAIKVAQMMSWPQFYTAVLGGIIAFAVFKILNQK